MANMFGQPPAAIPVAVDPQESKNDTASPQVLLTPIRFVVDHMELELIYLTERVLVAGSAHPAQGLPGWKPSTGLEALVSLLAHRHPNQFLVINLCPLEQKQQAPAGPGMFSVLHWGWPEGHPPPLATLFIICQSMASWLASDPSNVVTIFSRAGRGRAGTLASAFLLYCRLFTAPEEAMYYFAGRRCLGGGYSLGGGITQPSQKRYVRYMSGIIDGFRSPTHPWILRRIIFSNVLMANREGSSSQPYVKIYRWTHNWDKARDLVFTSKPRSRLVQSEEKMFKLDVGMPVAGDVLFRFKIARGRLGVWQDVLFTFVLHTGFIPATWVVRLHKCDLDDGCNRKDIPENLFVDLVFEPCANLPAVAPGDTPWDTQLQRPGPAVEVDGQPPVEDDGKTSDSADDSGSCVGSNGNNKAAAGTRGPRLRALPLTEVTDDTLRQLAQEARRREVSVETLMHALDANGRLVAATRHAIPVIAASHHRRRRFRSISGRKSCSSPPLLSVPSIDVISADISFASDSPDELSPQGVVSSDANSAAASFVDSSATSFSPPLLPDETWGPGFQQPKRMAVSVGTDFEALNGVLATELSGEAIERQLARDDAPVAAFACVAEEQDEDPKHKESAGATANPFVSDPQSLSLDHFGVENEVFAASVEGESHFALLADVDELP